MDEHFFEEHFEQKGKRASRKERKYLQQSDRSGYKKTDQDKKREKKVPSSSPGVQGQVLSISPEGIFVALDHQFLLCQLRGSIKKVKDLSKNLVAVGDFVKVLPLDEKEGIIEEILPRTSVLSRADNLSRKKEQLIAVNVDYVIIMASVREPDLKAPLIDRYLIAARKGSLHPVVVINKFDLDEDKSLALELKACYEKLGIPTFFISTITGLGIEELKKFLAKKTSVISGQSGVGKSSLLRLITEQDSLKVGPIVERTQKGAHTTTSALMIPLKEGGYCIDTPGIRSFGIWDLAKEEIEGFFPEIFEVGRSCRYPDCSHQHEPGCAVHTALEKNKISANRFQSYLTLLKEMDEKHRNR